MSATRPVDPAPVRRLLLIRPRYLGDLCLTLPALEAARAACPRARVAYLVEQESAPLLEGDPRVDELIAVPRRPGPLHRLGLIRRLRGFAPDVAFWLIVHHTKSGKMRRVPLSPALQAELRLRVGRLLPIRDGSGFTRQVRRHSGVERFHPHQMRHYADRRIMLRVPQFSRLHKRSSRRSPRLPD